MSDDLLVSNSRCPVEVISQDDLFDLELIQNDKASDMIFLIGTLIGIYVNTKAEQEILCPEKTQSSSQSTAANEATFSELIVVVILCFLVGTVIIAYTECIRLSRQKAELSKDPDQSVINNIKGSELNILGLFLRIAGYTFSVVGNQIKADNPV